VLAVRGKAMATTNNKAQNPDEQKRYFWHSSIWI
jgi:hypothetical protein